MKRGYSSVALFALAGIIATASFVPDVRYVRVTKVELEGTAGQVMSMVGRLTGRGMETTETVSISGHRMRTDRDKTSSIIDLDAETVMELDHKEKEYTVMTLSEYRDMLLAAMSRGAQSPPGDQAADADDTEVSFDVAVDPTNETKELLGQTARRYFVTLTTRVEPSGDSDSQADQGPPPGEMVMLTDTWLVPELPGREEEAEFQLLMVEKLWGGDQSSSGVMGMALSQMSAPQYKDGIVKMAEEMAKLGGVAVESITYTVSVPDGVEFDRASIIAPVQEKKGGGLGALARGLARRAAGQEQAARPQEAPVQRTLMTLSSATLEASLAPIDPASFEAPARYKKVDPKRD